MRSAFLNLSINLKLWLLSFVLSAFVLGSFGTGLYLYEKKSNFEERERSATRLSEITSRTLRHAIFRGHPTLIQDSFAIVANDEDFVGALVIGENGAEVFRSPNVSESFSYFRNLSYLDLGHGVGINRQKEKFILQMQMYKDEQFVCTVLMVFSYASIEAKLGRFTDALLISISLAVILKSIFSIRLQSLITKRLLKILRLIKEITSSRDYSLTVEDEGSDEISILGQNFNLMLSEVNQRDLSLRLANLSLESRVQERTHALEIAVNNLQEAQELITSKHAQILKVISNAPTAMAIFNPDKSLIVFSHKWKELFGLDYESENGRQISRHFPDSWQEAFDLALKSETNSAIEDYFKNAAGVYVFIRWTIQPWLDQEDNVCGVIIAVEDIGDLVRARDAAIRVAKTRTEFMANVSHELRTPLNGILGFASILQDSCKDPEQKEQIDLIKSSGEVLLRTINDVLDFSKLERGSTSLEKISLSPSKLLNELQKLFSSASKNRSNNIEVEIDSHAPERVLGDEFRLKQVLTNLIGNAIKFTERGTIRLKLNVIKQDSSHCKFRFCIEDSGVGIAGDKIADIFKPFSQADGSVTRKFGGTGLGLSIASTLVSLMGGKLQATSQLGAGSSFFFEVYFPIDKDFVKDTKEGQEKKSDDISLKGKRVLVAEDNQINLKLVKKILDKSGCEVTLAEDGKKAVDMFGQSNFDLVILDMQMPVMGGLEACQLIRQNQKRGGDKIPIVALTAHAFEEDKQKCLDAGMNSFLTKPIDRHELISTISGLIEA